MPSTPITKEASRTTGLSGHDGLLCYNGELLASVGTKEGLSQFIDFLESKNKPLCFGHNIQSFDCPILIHHLILHDLFDGFTCSITGFVDTLHLMKKVYPEKKMLFSESIGK